MVNPRENNMDKRIIKYNNDHIRVDLSESNTKIYSSYKVKKYSDIKAFILRTRMLVGYKNYAINNRKLFGMILEWRAHNLLYSLHLFRSHTKDVDLEYPQKWYYKIIWGIIGIF